MSSREQAWQESMNDWVDDVEDQTVYPADWPNLEFHSNTQSWMADIPDGADPDVEPDVPEGYGPGWMEGVGEVDFEPDGIMYEDDEDIDTDSDVTL